MTVCCYGVQVLLERQRRAVEEAREFAMREGQLRSAGRVAAEFTHQIKNPLAIINNAAFSLQRALKQGKPVSAEQIRIIQEEVERSDRIITEIMGYAQLSEGHVEKLNVIEELDHGHRTGCFRRRRVTRSGSIGITATNSRRCSCSAAICPRPSSTCCRTRAKPSADKGGNVFVSARCHSDYSVEVSIRDDGPGIPPDKHGEDLRGLLHHQREGHRPGPGDGEAQCRTLRRHRAGGIRAWKGRAVSF